jgi:tetratricopeptide (TPR) repeat protein
MLKMLLRLSLPLGFGLSIVFSGVFPAQSEESNAQLSNLLIGDAFQKGVDLFLAKDYTQAEGVFRQCLEREPNNAEYVCWLAQTLGLLLGERAKKGASSLSLLPDGRTVNSLYDKAIELDPTNQRARIGHAVILRDIPGWLGGSVKKAEEILRGVLKDNPQNLSAMHFLGTLYIRKYKKYEEGIGYLEQAVETSAKKPITPEEQYNLSNTYNAIGIAYLENLEKPDRAIPYFEKSLKIEPNSPVALLGAVEAYRTVDRIEDAKTTIRKAADVIKKNEYARFSKDLAKEARLLNMKKELDL